MGIAVRMAKERLIMNWKKIEVRLDDGGLMMRGGKRESGDTYDFSGIGSIMPECVIDSIVSLRPLDKDAPSRHIWEYAYKLALKGSMEADKFGVKLPSTIVEKAALFANKAQEAYEQVMMPIDDPETYSMTECCVCLKPFTKMIEDDGRLWNQVEHRNMGISGLYCPDCFEKEN